MAKILIVEDHPEMQKLYSSLLSYDYDIIAAYNIKQADAALAEHDIDLIILDIILPEQDRHTFLLDLRKNAKYKKTPVIVSTILSRKNQSVKMAEKIGKAIYFKKPFHPLEFKNVLDSYVSNANSKQNSGIMKYVNSD